MTFEKILLLVIQSWIAGMSMTVALVYWGNVHKFPYQSFTYSICNIILIIFLLSTYKFEDESVLEKKKENKKCPN